MNRPPVESHTPPALVLRIINPMIGTLLRSPLHRLLSRQLMLLSVSGRKTGRIYNVPVGRHESHGTFVVSASGTWRHNLHGGGPVRLTLDGHQRAGYAELEEEPDQVAQAYKALLDLYGSGSASLLGLKVKHSAPTYR